MTTHCAPTIAARMPSEWLWLNKPNIDVGKLDQTRL